MQRAGSPLGIPASYQWQGAGISRAPPTPHGHPGGSYQLPVASQPPIVRNGSGQKGAAAVRELGSRELGSTVASFAATLEASAPAMPSASSLPSEGGSVIEMDMHRKLTSMEGSLKEVDSLLKSQLNRPVGDDFTVDTDRCARMREEVKLMQQSRETIEARARTLEAQLQQEKLDHENWLVEYDKYIHTELKGCKAFMETSVTESLHLMKVKVVEAEKVLKMLIKQLNSSYAPALTEAEANGSDKAQEPKDERLKSAMQQLLEEHQQLVRQQNELLSRRQPLTATEFRPMEPPKEGGLWTAPANSSPVPIPEGVRSPGSPRVTAAGFSWAKASGTSSPSYAGVEGSHVLPAPGGRDSPSFPLSPRLHFKSSAKSSPKDSPKESPKGSPKGSASASPNKGSASASPKFKTGSASPASPRTSPRSPGQVPAVLSPNSRSMGMLPQVLEDGPRSTSMAAMFVDRQTGQQPSLKPPIYAV